MRRTVAVLAAALAVTACTGAEPAPSTAPTTVVPEAVTTTGVEDPGAGNPAATTAEDVGAAGGTTTSTESMEEGIETAPLDLEPTPAQQEGPYYPTEKPEERDNDLTLVAGATGPPEGVVLLLDGRLLTTTGRPVGGAVIEIWQTDANGIYSHPRDPKTVGRDPNFQFYGESITDEGGRWSFRTLDPGYYEPRPRHIHLKVRIDGVEALTSQIYFAGDGRLAGASVDDALIADVAMTDEDGATVLVATHDLVIDR